MEKTDTNSVCFACALTSLLPTKVSSDKGRDITMGLHSLPKHHSTGKVLLV